MQDEQSADSKKLERMRHIEAVKQRVFENVEDEEGSVLDQDGKS
jgi:hypothetical protein